MRFLIVVVGCLMLTACQTRGNSEAIRKQFFAGMTRDSYGRFVPQTFTAGQIMAVCNPNSSGAALDDLSVGIARGISEATGLDKAGSVLDEQIVLQDLKRHFKNPQGTTLPSVKLISTDGRTADFWYQPISVTTEEIAAAAADWCGRQKRRAVFEGTAVACRNAGNMNLGGAAVPMIETYAIVAHRCDPAAGAKPAKKS